MISRPSNRMENEWTLLTYSLKLLAGPGLIVIGMIMGVLLLMIFVRPTDIFGSKLALLLFHLETIAPLFGVVIFSGLLGADLDAQCLDNLRTSKEGIARVVLRKIYIAHCSRPGSA